MLYTALMTETETLHRESGEADVTGPAREPRAEPEGQTAPGWPKAPPAGTAGPPGSEPARPAPLLPRDLVLRALL